MSKQRYDSQKQWLIRKEIQTLYYESVKEFNFFMKFKLSFHFDIQRKTKVREVRVITQGVGYQRKQGRIESVQIKMTNSK